MSFRVTTANCKFDIGNVKQQSLMYVHLQCIDYIGIQSGLQNIL